MQKSSLERLTEKREALSQKIQAAVRKEQLRARRQQQRKEALLGKYVERWMVTDAGFAADVSCRLEGEDLRPLQRQLFGELGSKDSVESRE